VTKPRDPLEASFAEIVGPEHVLAAPGERLGYEVDWTGRFQGRARLVVRPADAAQVAEVVRRCAAEGVPIVPQGGNTGLVGGGVPRDGELVLSLRRLDGLGAVDADASQVTVGAGTTLHSLQERARASGLAFGVDFAARDSATIGGMVATNAGGMRALRYGAMRSQVLGLEAILASGERISWMAGLDKDTAGYHLPSLFVGSEGTLAIVTAARVRLVPDWRHRVVALLALPDVPSAVTVTGRLRSGLATLEAAELFFADGLELVLRHRGARPPFPRAWPVYLLVECAAGVDPGPDLVGILEASGEIEEAVLADDRWGRERLWALREGHSEAIASQGVPHKLDVGLPISTLAAFAARVPDVVRAVHPASRTIIFGHLGDGNLHVNVIGPAPDDERVDDAVLRLAASFGGTISAEHGVGVAKRRWLLLTRSPAEVEAMRAIKRAFDPLGILNPGVLFDPHPAG